MPAASAHPRSHPGLIDGILHRWGSQETAHTTSDFKPNIPAIVKLVTYVKAISVQKGTSLRLIWV